MATQGAGMPGGEVSGMASANELISAVRELVSLMRKGGISEVDLSTGDFSIRLRGGAGPHESRSSSSTAEGGPTEDAGEPEEVGHLITAPMIGTYYSAPSPGEAPFVQIGDEVEVGQVVGIIEAMKIMNEIVSDQSGIVREVLVENAQAVEYGSPLIRLVDQNDAYS